MRVRVRARASSRGKVKRLALPARPRASKAVACELREDESS